MKTNNLTKSTKIFLNDYHTKISLFARLTLQSYVRIVAVGGLLTFITSNSWGQIAQRGSATTNSANLTGANRTLSIPKPTGVQAGDVLIASIVQNETDNDNGGLTSNTANGWTVIKGILIRSDGTNNNDNAWYGTCLYRIADGTEGTNFLFSMPNDRADMAIGSIIAFSGVATNALKPNGSSGGPFDVVPSNFNNSNAITATATGVNVLNTGSAVIMIAMVNNDRTFSNWSNSRVELFDNITTNGDDASIGAAWSSCAVSGDTGNGTVTLSVSDRNTALLLPLRSATAISVSPASSNPSLCLNSTLTTITHSTTGATGIGTAIGLPDGVTASWASNTISINGTPTVSGTFNYNIPLSVSCGTANASGTITVTQPSTSITIDGNTIGNGDYLWNGALNSNANVKNNWYALNNGIYSVASQVPQATDEVFVVSASDAVSCVSNSNNLNIPQAGIFNASNINIGVNASVTLENGSSLKVKGDFTNNGNFNAGNGTVEMNGASLQRIKGAATTTFFKNLTINNANGVTLEQAVVVDSILLLTNGLVDLGSNHLTIGSSASISGTPGNSKMIVASGSGELRKQFSSGTYNPSSFTFPVGTSNGTNKYNPVVLDFARGTFGSSAYVGVRVQDQKNSLLHSDNSTYINKTWIVEPNSEVTNYKYNIKLYFNPASIAQGGDFVTTSGQVIGDLIPVKYSGGQWYQPIDGSFSGAVAQGFAGALVSNHLVWDSLTSFSEFGGVGGSNNPLPVELLSFSGVCEEGIINLTWQTASEFNSSHFDVEKSRDGENWQLLTSVPSAGTSNELITYQSFDKNGTDGNNYYRLRQVDIDGTEKVYDPINVSCAQVTPGYFTSFPNPSGSSFQLIVNNKELIGTCVLNIVDATGKVMEQREIEMNDGINMFVINQELTSGIYFLKISNGTKSTSVLRHAVK